MKKLRLISLRLRHFKGIESFDLNIDGGNVVVYGRNSAGKSTLADGYNWLLFGKDSRDSSTFQVKTIIGGEPMHHAEHSVEGVFDVDGETLTLKRVYTENWVSRRGQARKELDGHETAYFIDDLKVKKGEYDKRIAELVGDEKTLRILSDPTYFNDSLSWQERRKTLMELAPVDDEVVIKSDKKFKELASIIGKHSMENAATILKGQSKEARRALDAIPGRVQEAQRAIAPGAPTVKAAEAALASIEKQEATEAKRLEKARAAEREAYSTMIEAKSQVAEAQAALNTKANERRSVIRSDLSVAKATMTRLMREATDIANATGTCPACGQALTDADPEHQEKEKARIRAEFDAAKAEVAELEAALNATEDEDADPAPYTKAKKAHEKTLAALDALKPTDYGDARRTAQTNLSAAKASEAAKARIDELRKQEDELAAHYEEVERQLILIEDFGKARMERVGEAVNKLFSITAWKLFEPQITTGGVKEIADATVNGIPYPNLNTGARILAGLDIINALARHHGFAPPIFLDGAEALTSALPTEGQLIRLHVHKAASALTLILDGEEDPFEGWIEGVHGVGELEAVA